MLFIIAFYSYNVVKMFSHCKQYSMHSVAYNGLGQTKGTWEMLHCNGNYPASLLRTIFVDDAQNKMIRERDKNWWHLIPNKSISLKFIKRFNLPVIQSAAENINSRLIDLVKASILLLKSLNFQKEGKIVDMSAQYNDARSRFIQSIVLLIWHESLHSSARDAVVCPAARRLAA